MNIRFAQLGAFALLMAASCLFAQERAVGNGDVWQCAKADADGLVYVNTAQAERNMDPKLWARIQEDKKAAVEADRTDEEGDVADFDLFNKDVELLVNVRMVSKEPLRLAASGGIAFDKSEKGVWTNIVAMISAIAGEAVSLKTEEGDAFARFELLYNLDAAPPSGEDKPVPSRIQAVSNVRNGDSAIGVVLNTSAWAGMFPREHKEGRVLNRMLRAMETAEIRVRVTGVTIEAFLSGTFKSEVLARRYSKDLLDSLPAIFQLLGGGMLADIKPNMSGRVVSISLQVRLDLAWDFLVEASKGLSEANAGAPGPEDESDDDDSDEQ